MPSEDSVFLSATARLVYDSAPGQDPAARYQIYSLTGGNATFSITGTDSGGYVFDLPATVVALTPEVLAQGNGKELVFDLA